MSTADTGTPRGGGAEASRAIDAFPLVSVVISTYNRSNVVGYAIGARAAPV